MKADDVVAGLDKYARPDAAEFLGGFFKTAPGDYGAGDIFIGVRVPQTRAVCAKFLGLPATELQRLLDSPIHEHRLAALIIMVNTYARADQTGQDALFTLYLNNAQRGRINNWDLVDASAEFIFGRHEARGDHKLFFELAAAEDLWLRRIAMVGTFWLIRREKDASLTYALAEKLLDDKRDLVQKAVGWMLREAGKRVSRDELLAFLDKHAHIMPRTMLRYAIEHLSPEQRTHYMLLKNASK